jgi:hypothetical protein
MIEADPLPLMDRITVIRRIVEMTEDPERCRSEVGELVNHPRINRAMNAAQRMVNAKQGWGPTIETKS